MAQISVRELQTVLDQELARLPQKHRAPLLLCYLEGHTRDEAARQLGWPLGTLNSRVERGRELLRTRLARRGLTLSGALSAAILTDNAVRAALPGPLVDGMIKAALAYTGAPMGAGVVSAEVAALADGALKALSVTKLRTALALLVALCGIGTGSAMFARHVLDWSPVVASAQAPLPIGAYGEKQGETKPRPEAKGRRAPVGRGPTGLDIREQATLNVPDGWVDQMRFSPDGKTLVAATGPKTLPDGSSESTVHVWDAVTGRERAKIKWHAFRLKDVAITGGGKMLAVASLDKSARL
jgi:hypothetical protein